MATIVTNTDDAPEYVMDYARRLMEERRVSSRCMARVVELLEAQPLVNDGGLPNQTDTAKMLRQWTAVDGRPSTNTE
jgi:hypothetical protein